jgi:peptidyl-prolyl cis-trans isomerase D
MLQTLRENPAIKKGILWIVVAAMVLGIGIGVTAVLGDLLGTGRNSSTPTGPWVMRIGSEVITPAAFEAELRRVARELERLGMAEMPDFQARVRLEAMQRILRRTLETQEAGKIGLRVSDREVSDAIRSMPELQRDGQFIGGEEYRRLLAMNEVDVAGFEAGVRGDLLVGKWQELVGAGAVITDRDVDEELARRNQKIRYDFVLLDSSKYTPAGAIGEADIKAWYDQHPDRYQRSEARKARYVVIDVKEDDKELPATTEDDLRKAYEVDKARYPGTFEQAREAVARQLQFQKAQAESDRRAAVFRATVTDATAFEAAAAKAGLAVQDAGPVRRESEAPANLGPGFVDALFRAPKGSLGGPVRTLHGNAVFVVTDIEAPRQASLAESRSDILADLQKDKGREAAVLAARKAILGAGSDLALVAKALGAAVQNGTLVSRGEPVPGLGYDEAVEKAAFATEQGKLAEPVSTQGGSVVVLKVEEKKVPDPAALAADRDKIREELRRNRQLALVNSILEAAMKATEIKTNEEYLRQFGT